MSQNLHQIQSLVQQELDRDMQIDEPTIIHTSFIPSVQRSNVLLMSSLQPKKEDMTTLFIGTIRKNYTQEMWKYDCEHWMQHFGNQRYSYIQILPLEGRDAINDRDAIPKIEQALSDINQLPAGEKIRVIVMGTGHSAFLNDALTYLLREWKEPNNGLPRKGKYMQFITSGDTKDRDMSDFCQWLCVSGACENIEFYNTMHYHPFGYCSAEFSKQK